jgi:DoxX-like family
MDDARSTGSSVVRRKHATGLITGYWIATSLFALQMAFTAYAQLRLPQVAAAFTHLGFPAYFRIELSWLKFAGILVLLLPAPGRLKEWAYAGFAITLGSALIAHLSVGDDVSAWGWAAGTAVLWGISYYCWRRLQAGPAVTRDVTSAAAYFGTPTYPEPGV